MIFLSFLNQCEEKKKESYDLLKDNSNINPDVKIVESEYINCEINNKKREWSKNKLNKELRKWNHDIICSKQYQYNPFKQSCDKNFYFLKEGQKYYTSNEKLNSPSIHIAACGIFMTIIIGLLNFKNKKINK
ncbi:conserved Plasmodium protein, unknown function [Plasmodium sp. gorilla clade G2]|uniref:conserved Plasmodium protein, unknown function n=1 Tax=Plasmodium sp. gorilla clade G2 TaxID=880535 RepID=UPI000D208D4E|nr:conserved Plasmodium protein, unknown function [Plasmodium sp. gorilla clade G2]SOV11692.1 conserved Plasmodium protein, unknown function [Plasmodium sp. gorilla clade G2]